MGSTGTQRTLGISGGNSVTLDVAGNDNLPTNEVQTLSKTSSTVTLSAVSGTGGEALPTPTARS